MRPDNEHLQARQEAGESPSRLTHCHLEIDRICWKVSLRRSSNGSRPLLEGEVGTSELLDSLSTFDRWRYVYTNVLGGQRSGSCGARRWFGYSTEPLLNWGNAEMGCPTDTRRGNRHRIVEPTYMRLCKKMSVGSRHEECQERRQRPRSHCPGQRPYSAVVSTDILVTRTTDMH